MKNRVLTLLLALCMVLGMLCLPSLAAGSASGVTTPGGAVGGAGSSSGGGSSSIDPSAPMDPDLEDDETDPIYPGQLTGYCGSEGDGTNLTWMLKVDGTLVISGTGAMMDYGGRYEPWRTNKASIKAVRIQSGVTTVGDSAFDGCENLAVATIANSVITIGRDAFSNCVNLASVTIGTGVTTIDEYSFQGCTSLPVVVIPASVTTIETRAFEGCSSLESISVSENNTAYCDVDGVLFNHSKTELLQYPGGKSGAYTVPDSTEIIGTHAFRDCESLTCVNISDNVTAIGRAAFSGCRNLSEVTVGNSVSSIGRWAFAACHSLNKVEFLGNAPEEVEGNLFTSLGANTIIYYHEGTTGWPDTGEWQGKPLVMIPDGCTAQLGAVSANHAELTVVRDVSGQVIVGFYSAQGQMLAAQVFDNVATGESTLTITENRVDLTAVEWRVFFLNEQGEPADQSVTLQNYE